MKKLKIDILFILCVLIPSIFAIAYYGFIASNLYTSESSFLIRTPDRQSATSGLSLILRSAGFSRAQDDSYALDTFIASRDALNQLQVTTPIKQNYSSENVDFINRFGGLFRDKSFESFYKYYREKVKVKTDTTTAISTLTVKAYDPKVAYQINEHLLRMSEKLINNINTNARRDLITFAQDEVEKAEIKANAAAQALTQYRTRNRVFNPEEIGRAHV